MAKKTALYLRSSKDKHDVSVESQRRELRAYVAARGDVVVAEFEDKVESAKTANRPAFQEMMTEVKSSECRFSQVFCYDTSRFSRRKYDAQMYKHLLKKQDIELHFMKLPKSDPLMDPVMESLMEIFDEFHSQKSKHDGLRGMKENVMRGFRAGGPASIGYQLEKEVVAMRDGQPVTKSRMIADPVWFPKIKQYLEGRAQNEGRRSLAKRLDLDVSFTTLVYLEVNALTYAGHTVWNRHNERIDGRYVGGKRFRDEDEWVIVRDTHPAMITDDQAERILENRRKSSETGRRQRKHDYLLAGLLRCKCGAAINGNVGYYRCKDRCGMRSVKKEALEGAVISALSSEFLTESVALGIQREARAYAKNFKTESERERDLLAQRIAQLDREISDLVAILSQLTNKRAVLERLDQLEVDRAQATERLTELTAGAPAVFPEMTEGELAEFLDEFRKGLLDPDSEKRKALLRQLLDKAELEGDVVALSPRTQPITGLNLALPPGFEPGFKP